jgi:hypothetical protein
MERINKTKLILPVSLYGCENLSLTLWEEHRLRVFKSRVLRRISGENCYMRSFTKCGDKIKKY